MDQAVAHVVILGAGHAGGTAAALLRQYGFQGLITLVSAELFPPYHRPPLSKDMLRHATGGTPTLLKPAEFYEAASIRLCLGVKAKNLEPQSRSVELTNGENLQYDFLIIATGARPIKLQLAGTDLKGVLELRTTQDSNRLKSALGNGKRLTIIGGGFIGLEVAASARALGTDVTVVEREPRLLARVASEELSTFLKDRHMRHGVHFELGATAAGFEGLDGHLSNVRLADGRRLPSDAVLIAVGAIPNDEIARDAGLEVSSGVVVDLEARTSDPAIFAIGDVARRPIPHYGHFARVESVPNALEQAKQAVSAIVGRPSPGSEVPWQWSDQYDVKLQVAGQARDVDRVLRRDRVSPNSFTIFHLRGNRIQCVEAINSPQDFLLSKQLIARRIVTDPEKLKDSAIPLLEAEK